MKFSKPNVSDVYTNQAVSFTGTKQGITKEQKYSLNVPFKDLEADVLEDPKNPLARNRDIVALGEILVACLLGCVPQRRSGTWSTVRYAKSVDVLICMVYPDGTIVSDLEQ